MIMITKSVEVLYIYWIYKFYKIVIMLTLWITRKIKFCIDKNTTMNIWSYQKKILKKYSYQYVITHEQNYLKLYENN